MHGGLVHIINREILNGKKKGQIKTVGMDLDGNLTDLYIPEIYELVWNTFLNFLPDTLGRKLQRHSFKDISKNGNFKVGWFLDTLLGYTVVTDLNGKILAVKKGNERVGKEKILEAYGANEIIEMSQLLNIDRAKPRFFPYSDGFDFLEGIIKTEIAKTGVPLTKTIAHQIDHAIYQAHNSEDGFKRFLMENPEKYGIVPNKQLKDFLERVNKRYFTFLLTSSHKLYAEKILEALDISHCFQLIMTDAKKPACFSPYRSENKSLWEKLSESGVDYPTEIFYMGDHLYKDAILARDFGFFTGLRMKRVDINEIERKLDKYAGIRFERRGSIVIPINKDNETELKHVNTMLSQIYMYVHVLATKVQNLEPLLLY